MSDTVPCKTCRHIERDWTHFPFSFGSPYAFKCGILFTKEETNFDPITGKTSIQKPKALSCISARSKYGDCGVEGKLWEPKHKREFFVYLKRI
jgi:hypothetical protein